MNFGLTSSFTCLDSTKKVDNPVADNFNKLRRSAFFDVEKCIPNKTHPTTTENSAPSPTPMKLFRPILYKTDRHTNSIQNEYRQVQADFFLPLTKRRD